MSHHALSITHARAAATTRRRRHALALAALLLTALACHGSRADTTITETFTGTVTSEESLTGLTCTVTPCPMLVGDTATFVITFDASAAIMLGGTAASPNYIFQPNVGTAPTMTVLATFMNGPTVVASDLLSSYPNGNISGAPTVSFAQACSSEYCNSPQVLSYGLSSKAATPATNGMNSPLSTFGLSLTAAPGTSIFDTMSPSISTPINILAAANATGDATFTLYNTSLTTSSLTALEIPTITVQPSPLAAGGPPGPATLTGTTGAPANPQSEYLNNANLGSSTVSWFTPANPWTLLNGTPTRVPLSGDDVYVINNSGANASAPTVVNFDDTTGPSFHSLTIDGNSSTDPLITLSQSANALASGSETIGTTGPAEHLQTGGINAVSGVLTINQYGSYNLGGTPVTSVLEANTIQVNGGSFTFAGGAVQFAYFYLTGGTVTATGDENLDVAGETGNYAFIQSGGSNTVTGNLLLGGAAGVYGGYDLQSGSVIASGEIVGNNGVGGFTQSDFGNSNTINGNLILANNAGSSGSYALGPGLAGAPNTLQAQNEIIGLNGIGQFIQEAYTTNTVTGTLTVAQPGAAGSAGSSYQLESATVFAGAIQINSGGTFTESVYNDIHGNPLSATLFANTLTVASGGTFTEQGGNANLGSVTVGGVANLLGGLSTASVQIQVPGSFDQTGGTASVSGTTTNAGGFTVGSLTPTPALATFETANFSNSGTVIIGNGGTLDIAAAGCAGPCPAAYIQTLGMTTVLAGGVIDPFTITINGGTFGGLGNVAADSLNVGSGASATQNGGNWNIGNALIAGALNQVAGVLNGGSVTFVSGSTGTLSGGSTAVTGTIEVGGNLNVTASELLSSGLLQVDAGGSIGLNGGNSTFSSALINGILNQGGGIWGGTNVTFVSGSTGTLSGGSTTVTGTITVDGGGGLAVLASELLSSGVVQVNSGGNLTLGGGTTTVTSLNDAGLLQLLPCAPGTPPPCGGSLFATSVQIAAGGTGNFNGGTTMVSGDTMNAGAVSVLASTFTTAGTFTNGGIGNSVTIGAGATLNAGHYLQTSGATLLRGGTLDPTAVEITGGTFGGTGTVIGNVSLSNGAILNVGGPGSGLLQIQGSLTQTGGAIDFLVDSSGASRLEFDSADGVSIANADIVFDFTNAAAETAFLDSESLDLDAFFLDSNGLAGAGLAGLFNNMGDTFEYEIGTGPMVDLTLDPTTGDLNMPVTSNVPEPSTLGLTLPGLGLLGLALHRRRRRQPE